MYIASVAPTKTKISLSRVSGNVVALGMVSLVTDISSEMVTAVLPLYLVLGLGLNPLQFGLLDGLYAGATAVVRDPLLPLVEFGGRDQAYVVSTEGYDIDPGLAVAVVP
ncbi:hypothetical protein ACFQ1S_24345, partial [Kibdelosporangium lantanae]